VKDLLAREIAYTERKAHKGQHDESDCRLLRQWIMALSFSKYYYDNSLPLRQEACTVSSGWVHKPDIPIINERLLHWILGVPHRKNLRSLWQIGEEHRFLPKRGKHFLDEDVPVEFGDVRFLGKGLGMTWQAPWDPVADIDLTGLT